MNTISEIGFIGFGLIGGSIAKALKQDSNAFHIIVLDHHKDQKSPGLLAAKADGVIDEITSDLNDFTVCDMILLCAPVLTNLDYLKQLTNVVLKKDCILTDVGSVKGSIHHFAQECGLSSYFIGGHPMAGSEKTGYVHACATLLENAYYILTPTEHVSNEKLETMISFVKRLHALPIILDAKEHDNITAAISHVPHIIAAQLVNLIRTDSARTEQMKLLAAGGFKDITRIASSSPVMWQNICLTNTESICMMLEQYIHLLNHSLTALKEKDEKALYDMFHLAGEYRSQIPNRFTGIITPVYETYLDITDEPGAIASIATLLGSNSLSIKNIGIVHNREFEQGVLRIEFYDEKSLMGAIRILKGKNYTIYERQ